jgi:hypothetical protein
MTTKTRQTASNNAILARAKRVWNAPIYKRTSEVMNAEGEAAAIAYLQQFVVGPVVAHMDDVIDYLDRRNA